MQVVDFEPARPFTLLFNLNDRYGFMLFYRFPSHWQQHRAENDDG